MRMFSVLCCHYVWGNFLEIVKCTGINQIPMTTKPLGFSIVIDEDYIPQNIR